MEAAWAVPTAIGGALVLWSLGAACTGRFAVENARYTVIKAHPTFEVRAHPPHVIASIVTPEAAMKSASSSAFRSLAGFIFGRNEQSSSIAMTSPVTISPGAAGHTVWFVLPAKYHAVEEVPAPLDRRVLLSLVPRGLSAVRPLRATWGERLDSARFREEAAALLRDVGARGLRVPQGEVPRQLAYDPPWTPFWMRRDEVSVAVEEGS